MPQVEVTFDIDANGILNVAAQDKATGKEQKITITASTNLSKSDVERMVQEGERHRAEDQRRKELIEARNQADSTVYTVEKTLRELGDKVPAGDRSRIEERINAVKAVMKGDDTRRIRDAVEQLQQASYALSQQLYQSQQAYTAPSGNGSGPAEAEDEDVVEGEFRTA